MLEVAGLSKSFGGKPALREVSFSVGEGEVFGLLGHNGAGKSTALGIVLGMVEPDAGEVRLAGYSVQKNRARALGSAGAIFETPSFYDYLSGWDNLRVLMSYSGGFDASRAGEVVEQVGLTERIGSRVSTYSHGMRQRLALAQALLPEPKVLLLDEPTDGLDPEGIKWFRDFVLRLREERGMTVLFNSHLLSEVELMCDRVAIIRRGRLVYQGDLEGIADERVILQIDVEPHNRAQACFRTLAGEDLGGGRVAFPEGTDPAVVSRRLVEAGLDLRELTRVRRSLEDVYLEVTGSGEAGPTASGTGPGGGLDPQGGRGAV
ncbi:MAG: ABC transporter ATP-binding protein [Akkermansiaceae bacterium]|nr:ABC transporter ATP-binding protein [Akkermansiaceae bacterium]